MPAVPFKVRAVFEYKSDEADDLSFANGQIITVTEDDDADWYTGEYTNAAGEKVDGIFPRNFVEKYEPAIPSRPVRTPKRAPAADAQAQAQAQPEATPPPPVAASEAEAEPVQQPPPPAAPVEAQPAVARDARDEAAAAHTAAAEPRRTAAPAPAARTGKPGPPPVGDKPSSSSFKDRIAAFNKPAAPPVAPFKPSPQTASSGFIKKSFVAPPPSKNSYVPPPPRDIPPPKIYRREEDPSLLQDAERDGPGAPAPPPVASAADDDEEQPKPTTLKERIALLQKQQLENAQRQADAAAKKDKPRKPAKKRPEAVDEADPGAVPDTHHEPLPDKAVAAAGDESEDARPPPPAGQVPPVVPLPARELVSDTNDADDSGAADTEDAQETSTEEERPRPKAAAAVVGHGEAPDASGPQAADHGRTDEDKEGEDDDQDQEEDDDDEEEEEEDPEIRRRRELRDRMAKMSGGMGMMGMFGPPGGLPAAPPRKAKAAAEHRQPQPEPEQQEDAAATARAPPVPVMPLPGMAPRLPKRQEDARDEDGAEDDDDAQADTVRPTRQVSAEDTEAADDRERPLQPAKRSFTGRSVASAASGESRKSEEAPSLTSAEREVPAPPPAREARAPPPPLPTGARPGHGLGLPQSPTSRAPPPPPPSQPVGRISQDDADRDEEDEGKTPPPQPPQRQRSFHTPASPVSAPPVPPALSSSPTEAVLPPLSSPTARPPPPPPPVHPPSRTATSESLSKKQAEDESDEGETEYDGDYDTDIASSAKHKDALKAHNRDSSVDDDVLTDDATKSPRSPPTRAIPPLPPSAGQRDAPLQPTSRKSMDAPKAAPPPVPPPKVADDDEYDPYRYSAPQQGLGFSPTTTTPQYAPTLSSPRLGGDDEDMYGAPSQPPRPPPAPLDRPAPPPPMMAGGLGEPPAPPTQSAELKRQPTVSRRSLEQSRLSGEYGIIASDIDLAPSSFWWTQDNLLPPALQGRHDFLYEMESSTSAKRGGRTTVSRDVYVLYQDYSQTTINATFDQADPSHVALEQNHQRPPPPPRKDQLEHASEAFGAKIAAAASGYGAGGATVADGSAHGFVNALFQQLDNALKPVGIRAYGALVYANLANASTQQFDEIRPGDIVTFRNAKFAGHKGGLHQKYSLEVGKPDHAAVVLDWDGTKKKIRAWEQRGEEKGKRAKVREESFRVGDLKSGEVLVWRVMSRVWVGWDKS